MSDVFNTGIRPHIDAYLKKKSEEKRDYGGYWSASSAGYCMRKLIFERLGVPPVAEDDPRKTRVFESGHIFHQWLQDITKNAGISVAQELELIDDKLMIKGHFDDLVLIDGKLIVYDYKTQNSRAFHWQKKNGSTMSHFHKMQLGTYMYMLRKAPEWNWQGEGGLSSRPKDFLKDLTNLSEARIMKVSKDDLSMTEEVLLWTPALEKEVYGFWSTLNGYWNNKKLPACTCADYEGGFMAKPAYNPFYFKDEPCSLEWYKLFKEKQNAV